jgi:hypothetical protein
MMHDVYAYTQRERQIERAARDAAKPPRETVDITKFLDQLHCKNFWEIAHFLVKEYLMLQQLDSGIALEF